MTRTVRRPSGAPGRSCCAARAAVIDARGTEGRPGPDPSAPGAPRPTPGRPPPGRPASPPRASPARASPPPGRPPGPAHAPPPTPSEAPTTAVPPASGPATTPPAAGGGVSGVRVTGQALAAVTTATAGGFLGGAGGTVVGAAVASVVTTVGEALYQRSLERTRDRVRKSLDAGRSRRGGPAAGATAVVGPGLAPTRVAPAGTRVLAAEDLDDPRPDETPTVVLTPTSAPPVRTGHGRRVAVLAATGVLIFLIAMVVVTGIERVKGSPLSGGEGTSVGEVFGTRAPTTTTSGASDDDTTTARSTSEAPTSTRTTTTRTTVTTTRSRGGAPATTLVTPTP